MDFGAAKIIILAKSCLMSFCKWAAIISLMVPAWCLLEFTLYHYFTVIREFETAFFSLQDMALPCLLVWCATFFLLTWRTDDWFLVIFLLIAAILYLSPSDLAPNMILLIFGVTVGKGTNLLLSMKVQKSERASFFIGLLTLLMFVSIWHLDMSSNCYHGPRWTGLCGNPNTYGMLMGSGVVLAVGLLMPRLKKKRALENLIKVERSKWIKLRIFLGICIFMLGFGLVMSYSRGAWLATGVGFCYLAWHYGKIRWRYILPIVVVVVVLIPFLWNHTPDSAPWYVKRADLGRASAQHRLSAWRAGLEIMRDHPFGIGWNKAVSLYYKNYSPPEGGAAAITTNDYLMVGTELGVPALMCFVTYLTLCYRTNRRSAAVAAGGCGSVSPPAGTSGGTPVELADETSALRVACRSGALAMLVAFWFDGGLFQLPTAALFWVLLELGSQVPKPFYPTQPALLNNFTETSGAMKGNSQSPS